MATDRELANILSSGEIGTIQLGDVNTGDRVLKQSEVDAKITLVDDKVVIEADIDAKIKVTDDKLDDKYNVTGGNIIGDMYVANQNTNAATKIEIGALGVNDNGYIDFTDETRTRRGLFGWISNEFIWSANDANNINLDTSTGDVKINGGSAYHSNNQGDVPTTGVDGSRLVKGTPNVWVEPVQTFWTSKLTALAVPDIFNVTDVTVQAASLDAGTYIIAYSFEVDFNTTKDSAINFELTGTFAGNTFSESVPAAQLNGFKNRYYAFPKTVLDGATIDAGLRFRDESGGNSFVVNFADVSIYRTGA